MNLKNPKSMNLIMENWREYQETVDRHVIVGSLLKEFKERELTKEETLTAIEQLHALSIIHTLTEQEEALLEASLKGALDSVVAGVGKVFDITKGVVVGTTQAVKNPKKFVQNIKANVEARIQNMAEEQAARLMKDPNIQKFVSGQGDKIAQMVAQVTTAEGQKWEAGELDIPWSDGENKDWSAFGEHMSEAIKNTFTDEMKAELQKTLLALIVGDVVELTAEELKVNGIPSTKPQKVTAKMITLYFIQNSSKQIVFGFIDNFLMVLFGAAIDRGIEAGLSATGMALSKQAKLFIVAGLGNTFSDAVGEYVADWVEGIIDVYTDYETPSKADIEGSKILTWLSKYAGVLGIIIGCLLGMGLGMALVLEEEQM